MHLVILVEFVCQIVCVLHRAHDVDIRAAETESRGGWGYLGGAFERFLVLATDSMHLREMLRFDFSLSLSMCTL